MGLPAFFWPCARKSRPPGGNPRGYVCVCVCLCVFVCVCVCIVVGGQSYSVQGCSIKLMNGLITASKHSPVR